MQNTLVGASPVLASTKYVIERARDVSIDKIRISHLSKEWREKYIVVPHRFKEDILENVSDRTLLDYLFLLDTTNFCFWPPFVSAKSGSTSGGKTSEGRIRKEKWNIEYRGKRYDGHFALSLSWKRFFEENPQKANLKYLSQISYKEFVDIFKGKGELQFLKERWQGVRVVSWLLLGKYNGDSRKFIESARHRFSILVPKIYKELPTFADIAKYNNRKIYFLKRAQILAEDIYFAFGNKGIGHFKDLGYLTAMADYKLPQILQYYRVLKYSAKLENKIRQRILIPVGSKEEVEIRSATVWAVEYLKEALAEQGKSFHAFEIDWILWVKSQNIEIPMPYHLTKTIYY